MKLELTVQQINTIFVALQRNAEIIQQTMEEIQKQGQTQTETKPEDITIQP